jgi:hypothetical protein
MNYTCADVMFVTLIIIIMLWITSWVIAPVIRDTVYKDDTCPGTKDYPSSYSYCGYSSSYGFSGNPPYNINRSLTYGITRTYKKDLKKC